MDNEQFYQSLFISGHFHYHFSSHTLCTVFLPDIMQIRIDKCHDEQARQSLVVGSGGVIPGVTFLCFLGPLQRLLSSSFFGALLNHHSLQHTLSTNC